MFDVYTNHSKIFLLYLLTGNTISLMLNVFRYEQFYFKARISSEI